MTRHASDTLFERAQKTIPGGVNSPVRAFKGVGGNPVFFVRGDGAHVFDADGNRYIDYVGSWGPMILGHNHPDVVEAVQRQASSALGFGAPTELEIQMAEDLVERIPSLDLVRMVNSGTEATMSAIRLARGATGRDLIVKFQGCYHGHSDSLLVKAGSGVLTLGIPNSPGVPAAIAEMTLNLTFNDSNSVRQAFSEYGDKIAAVIVEPVAGNMGCIAPLPGFLADLRSITSANGSLLIFDEVMTGCRVARGGAQELYDVTPDLTTLGKVIGGGLPVGAFGGKREVMEHIAPLGGVYQAGTLSGNPLAMAAGLATLAPLDAAFYATLTARTERLKNGLLELLSKHGLNSSGHAVGGMFGVVMGAQEVSHFEHVANSDINAYNRFFHGLLDNGVYFAPSAFEAGFVSIAHDDAVIDETLQVADSVLSSL